jgi:carbon-monoxide dehydrogenase medium subunit
VLVLGAQFTLYGPTGKRSVPATEFFVGPGQSVLQPAELMTSIHFPALPAGAAGRYLKLGRTRAGDLALVGVAVLGFSNGPSASSGCEFRIGLGSVAPVPMRATEAEDLLAANPPGEELFALAAQRAMTAASPITDVRGSAGYQQAMVRTLALRALRAVWAQLQEVK